jgi:hypothetical protein
VIDLAAYGKISNITERLPLKRKNVSEIEPDFVEFVEINVKVKPIEPTPNTPNLNTSM